MIYDTPIKYQHYKLEILRQVFKHCNLPFLLFINATSTTTLFNFAEMCGDKRSSPLMFSVRLLALLVLALGLGQIVELASAESNVCFSLYDCSMEDNSCSADRLNSYCYIYRFTLFILEKGSMMIRSLLQLRIMTCFTS